MKPSFGVIGDAHLGFKAYDSERRTEETTQVFFEALTLLSDLPIICFPGDIFDDTIISNKIKRTFIAFKEQHPDQIWVICGGNHDSVKTYSSTSTLDVMSELKNVFVVNNFEWQCVHIDGLEICIIPHHKSQTAYLQTIDNLIATKLHWDIILTHGLVHSALDLGPNDMNLDLFRLRELSKQCSTVWIGHTHEPEKFGDNAYIPGSTMEFDFGQLGPKYVYRVDNLTNVKKITLPQPRKMIETSIKWENSVELLRELRKLDEEAINKVKLEGIPAAEYSTASNTLEAFLVNFKGDIITDVHKIGSTEVAVTAIDAAFDLREEFIEFAEKYKVPNDDKMLERLDTALMKLAAEEEDASL